MMRLTDLTNHKYVSTFYIYMYMKYAIVTEMAKLSVLVKDIWRFEAATAASCCFIKQHVPASLIPRQIIVQQLHFS